MYTRIYPGRACSCRGQRETWNQIHIKYTPVTLCQEAVHTGAQRGWGLEGKTWGPFSGTPACWRPWTWLALVPGSVFASGTRLALFHAHT